MLNFLALLGWSPGNDIEVMTLDADGRAVRSADGLQKKAAVFDPKKLEWMNGQHLSLIAAEELAAARDAGARGGGARDRGRARRAARRGISRCSTCSRCARAPIDDIVRQAAPYFARRDRATIRTPWRSSGRTGAATTSCSRRSRDALAALPGWEAGTMEEALRALAERLGFGDKAGKIFQPLRVALTGLGVSPGSSTC